MDTLALDEPGATAPRRSTTGRPGDGDGLLTLAQAAEALGLPDTSVRRRIETGPLEAEQVDGKLGTGWRVRLTTAHPSVARLACRLGWHRDGSGRRFGLGVVRVYRCPACGRVRAEIRR